MCKKYMWLVALLLLFTGLPFAHAQKDQDYSSFKKPIFSYLGIEGRALRRLRDWQIQILEKEIRKAIEKGRFIFVKLPFQSVAEGRYVQKMVSIVAAKAMGIAKMRAAWDSEFQGYAVSTELLESVQNNSFYYWIEVTHVRRRYSSGNVTYHMGARLHIRQLRVFPCTSANRQKGRRYFRACRRKSDDEYSGFAKPFRIVKAFVKGSDIGSSLLNVVVSTGGGRTKNRTVFRNTAINLGRNLFKKMASIKDFQLHAPVMNATFNGVTTNIGKSEGVTVNQGYKVYVRRLNGKYLYRGYVRIRRIGDNRMKMVAGEKVRVNPKAPFLTEGQIISVSNGTTLQKGMLMFEHPLLGVSIGVSVGLAPLTILENPNGTSLGIPFPIIEGTVLGLNLRLNTEFDLSNATSIPEFYLSVAVDFGLVGSGDDRVGFLLPILPSIGIIKKFYFRNLGLSLGARAVAGYLYSDVEGASAFMLGGEGLIGLDIFIVPEFTLTVRAGFRGAIAFGSPIISVGPWFMLGGNYTF